jgi:integrase/recombinase XerD
MRKIKRSFPGYLGGLMKRHLKLHRSYGLLLNGAEHTLMKFNRFLRKYYPEAKLITREMIVQYLKTVAYLHSTSLHTEITHLRKFCRFMFSVNAKSYIPQRALIPRSKRKVIPYIYTHKEIAGLLNSAKKLGPPHSLRGRTYVTIISLLWVTGLRISEALRLNIKDIDFEQNILHVQKSKFFKSRIIPLSKSSIKALKAYRDKRADYGFDQRSNAPFFVNQRATRCSYSSVSVTFRGLLRERALKTPQGTNPRLHDIRHAFATRWLDDFYKWGRNPNAYLPILATYLGHVNIDCTQTYLHPSIDVLTNASKKFLTYISNQTPKRI